MNNTFQNYTRITGIRSIVGGIKFPWQVEYAYVDNIEYFADQLFIDHGIKNAKFKDMANAKHPDEILVFIKFSKKYENKFILVMDELKNKCLLCGSKEYEKTCTKFFDDLKSFIGGNK